MSVPWKQLRLVACNNEPFFWNRRYICICVMRAHTHTQTRIFHENMCKQVRATMMDRIVNLLAERILSSSTSYLFFLFFFFLQHVRTPRSTSFEIYRLNIAERIRSTIYGAEWNVKVFDSFYIIFFGGLISFLVYCLFVLNCPFRR